MSTNSNAKVVVFPKQHEFLISSGNVELGSITYANSSNAYRGARSAMRNLLKNKNLTNESNYGDQTVAITNNNGYVIAATNEFSKKATATGAVKRILDRIVGQKKYQLEVDNVI